MITLLLTIGVIYFAIWLVINILGVVFKVAFFPVRLVIGLVLGIIGFLFLTPFVAILIVPAIILLILWAIGKVVSL